MADSKSGALITILIAAILGGGSGYFTARHSFLTDAEIQSRKDAETRLNDAKAMEQYKSQTQTRIQSLEKVLEQTQLKIKLQSEAMANAEAQAQTNAKALEVSTTRMNDQIQSLAKAEGRIEIQTEMLAVARAQLIEGAKALTQAQVMEKEQSGTFSRAMNELLPKFRTLELTQARVEVQSQTLEQLQARVRTQTEALNLSQSFNRAQATALAQELEKFSSKPAGKKDKTIELPTILTDPTTTERQKKLAVELARAAYIKSKQMEKVHRNAFDFSREFLQLTKAREGAGQVTKLDVFNAEVLLGKSQQALIIDSLLLREAEWDLKETGVQPEEVEFMQLEFGEQGHERIYENVIADYETGIVLLSKTNDKGEASKRILFQAVRVKPEDVADSLEKNSTDKHLKRKIDLTHCKLQMLERNILLQGKTIEQSKRSVDAAHISFDRGLKDSFDIIYARNELLRSKADFVSSIAEYNTQLATLEFLLQKEIPRTTETK